MTADLCKKQIMEHHKLVLPEHMNHQHSLFGGYLLKWIDEVAFMTAKLQFPHLRLVTISLDNVVFKHRIECGEIIRFCVCLRKQGTTSLTYHIAVKSNRPDSDTVLFETHITFVSVDERGEKCAI
jgi:acyl-CoA hydrolase